MADFTVTAANVQQSADAIVEHVVAGVAITAGQACYKDTAGLAQLTDADHATAANRAVTGIAINNAAAGQYVTLCSYDPDFTPGFTIAGGATVFTSGTAGGLCPQADVTTGDAPACIGVGIGSDKIILNCANRSLKTTTVL